MRPSKDPQKALGAALAALREEKDLTQREVARRSDLSTAHYNGIESGHTNPSWGTMRRIAKAFGVSLKDIADREAEREV
jgi:transcriptional regulator with XRE-family HTH domain